MVLINWTNRAKDDLRDIAEYISKDSYLYAKRQVLKIRQRTEVLKSKNYINIGHKVNGVDDDNIRQILEGNYRIIYRIVSQNRIDILTIHHSYRDLQNLKL